MCNTIVESLDKSHPQREHPISRRFGEIHESVANLINNLLAHTGREPQAARAAQPASDVGGGNFRAFPGFVQTWPGACHSRVVHHL